MSPTVEQLWQRLFQAHPWHGVSPGDGAPAVVTAFVEIVPTDTVKYEVDKASGLLKVDRPQRYSSLCPTLYGFVPQTYCGPHLARRCVERTARQIARGDGDPLDICVLTEKAIPQGSFLVQARPIGGLRLVDAAEADDKVIAVLEGDVAFGAFRSLDDCPSGLLERLSHYFLSYKRAPGAETKVEIAEVYDAAEAREVIACSMRDYREAFGTWDERLTALVEAMGARR